jgi:hypothetical protein
MLGIVAVNYTTSGGTTLHLAQTAQQAVQRPLAFAWLVRANPMHRKRIDRLLEPEKQQAQQQTKWYSYGLEIKPDSSGSGPGVTWLEDRTN